MGRTLLAAACLVAWWWGGPAQATITPEQAIQSVRDFCGDPGLACTVDGPHDLGPDDYYGLHYGVRVAGGRWAGLSTVRASDGLVLAVCFGDDAEQAPEPPVLTLQQAQSIAEQFVAQHFPDFAQRQWFLQPQHQRAGGEYHFAWREVLNGAGTLAPDELNVDVNGTTGAVRFYGRPRDIITAPTEPQITQEQALLLAAPYAVYDLNELPFSEVRLGIREDPAGVQTLVWMLAQLPLPDEPEWRYEVWIDAITGAFVLHSAPMGEAPRRVALAKRRARLPAAIRGPRGSPIYTVALSGGSLWTRAEVLRSFGAVVEAEPARLQVRVGKRSLGAPDLGACWRDYGWWVRLRRPVNVFGWWVPLRQAAKAIGWRVEWRPATREAVVYTEPSR